MEELATNTATAIGEIAKLGKTVGNFFSESYGSIDKFSDDITDFIDRITFNSDAITRRNVGQARRSFGGGSGGAGGNIADNIARRNAEAAATKRAKELAALQKKTLDTQKKSLALQKASKTIDLERIGIEAALKGEISKTDQLSLNLQLALLDKNEAAALKLSNQLDAAVKRQNDLAASLLATPQAPNPYEHWKIPADLLAYTASSLGVSVSQLSAGSLVPTSGYTDAQLELMSAVNSAQRAADQLLNIQVYLDGDIVGSAVRNSSVNSSLSGSFNSVNRVGRFAGLTAE
jgi:hypothetical protein